MKFRSEETLKKTPEMSLTGFSLIPDGYLKRNVRLVTSAGKGLFLSKNT